MLCSCSPRTMTTTNPNRPSNNLWVQTCAKLNKDRSASNPRDRKWSIISFTRKSRPEFIAHFSLVSLDTSLICGSLAKTLMFSLVSWSIRAISFRDLSTIIFYHQSVEFSNAISPLSFLVSSGSQHCVGSVALLNVIALSQNWSLLLATVWLTVWFSEKAVQRDNSLSNCNQRHSKKCCRKLISSGRKLSNSDSRRENPSICYYFWKLNSARLEDTLH